MINLKKTTLASWLVAISVTLGSTQLSAEQHTEQGADPAVAAQLKQKLNRLTTFTASFDQQVKDAQGEPLQSATGQLTFKQPNLMIWQVFEPDENLMVADGETLWYSDPFVEQVTAIKQADSIASNPVVLLTDPQNQAWQDFYVLAGDQGYRIIAKQPESQIVELQLRFENERLTSLAFVDRQGQHSQLQFSDIQQNRPIGDEQFSFSVPDGFELDDQR